VNYLFSRKKDSILNGSSERDSTDKAPRVTPSPDFDGNRVKIPRPVSIPFHALLAEVPLVEKDNVHNLRVFLDGQLLTFSKVRMAYLCCTTT